MACSKSLQPLAPRRRASLRLISAAHLFRRRRGERASSAADDDDDDDEGYEAWNLSVTLEHPTAHAERDESLGKAPPAGRGCEGPSDRLADSSPAAESASVTHLQTYRER
jgi:hypothetical protein